jgi:hypothetical protein
MIPRRTFLHHSALAATGGLAFFGRLPSVSAQDAKLDPKTVRFAPEIEPLVRLLEETARDRVLEEVASRIRRGTSYREVLTALLLAGIRNVQPRPVGFKFHAVLVVNSAHLASLASPDAERWLPIFWAIDSFKRSQEADGKEGDWTLGPVEESAVPRSERARAAFIAAMDNWDEAAADAAIAGLVRTAGADELFDLIARYGVRDFRDIGHKAIYVANSFRTLEAIGWQHAEPVLRSLAYALLDRAGARENPAQADLPADRPYRQNLQAVKTIGADWRDGRKTDAAEMLAAIRTGSSGEASELTCKLLARGTAPTAIFDTLLAGSGELLMQAPGILSLHATTFTNAVRYCWNRAHDDTTRRLLLLQNAAFLPLYRGSRKDDGRHLDALEPLATGEEPIEEIFTEISRDRTAAARKLLAYLQGGGDSAAFAQAARRMIFRKGRDSHDYKFSAAVLEDHAQMAPPLRDRFLAASAFYLRGTGDPDNDLTARTRAALGG